eukprot:GHVT01007457.1.p1 GENE.GHVT01007457.1~~GHVT01007457.1.p1  ORF type:complete len:149 (+),score=21.60 GHVT01007457.1:383-829(+)
MLVGATGRWRRLFFGHPANACAEPRIMKRVGVWLMARALAFVALVVGLTLTTGCAAEDLLGGGWPPRQDPGGGLQRLAEGNANSGPASSVLGEVEHRLYQGRRLNDSDQQASANVKDTSKHATNNTFTAPLVEQQQPIGASERAKRLT